MNVFDSYAKYRSELPKYASWKNEKNILEAQRLAYLKRNNITPKDRHSDVQRAEAILNCIDIMDEFSQTRAEDAEIVTNQGKTIIAEIGEFAGLGVSALYFLFSKSARNAFKELENKNLKSVKKLILPSALGIIPIIASIVYASIWGAGTEVKASKIGRAEAINQRLNSPKQFAELTDKQEKEVEEIAKSIELSPKEAKKMTNANGGFGILKSIKTMFSTNTREMETIKKISSRINDDKKYFDTVQLSDKEIEEAKRDKQLIQNVVEKIDIASQDYAEDVELVTGILTTCALAGGGLVGWVTNKLLSKIPKLQKSSKILSVVVGLTLALALDIPCANAQKQASRVGRYKVKQDFLNNPEKLIYVNDDKVTDEDYEKYLNTNKKDGFFKFMLNIFKENKKYNEYLKTEYLEAQKRSLAREKIEITPEQEKRAKQLQINTFKMFNILDEKSQNYSESVEALGEMCGGLMSTIITLIGTIWSMMNISKAEKVNFKAFIPAIVTIALSIPINIYTTKEQKKASKVANMLAINEMDDYRNFADYSNKEYFIQSKAN